MPPKKVQQGDTHANNLADKVINMGQDGTGTFIERLAKRLEREKVSLPSVIIEYKHINVEADALAGSAAVPSIYNAAKQLLLGTVGLVNHTSKYKILKDVSGVLKPGRMTLLLGPPGGGKTVLLQALSGRLKSTNHFRMTGDVLYNGHENGEFVIERTAAYVNQHDYHIPMLTVAETLTFAFLCQVGKHPKFEIAEELQENAKLNRKRSYWFTGPAESEFYYQKRLSTKHFSKVLDSDGSVSTSTLSIKKNNTISNAPTLKKLQIMSDHDFDKFAEEVWGSDVKIEAVIRFLGLTRCKNTILGGPMMRGVSGGEKKRVTTAEMMVGPQTVFVMDEISTGLDSATLFSVINWLSKATHALKLNTIISLLQPPPETFMQFDDLLLLADGCVVYHGPVKEAIPFFESMGFKCPERKDRGSFLQEITTAQGQYQYATPELRRTRRIASNIGQMPSDEFGSEKKLIIPLEEIQYSFWNENEHGREMSNHLKYKYDKSLSHPKALVFKRYALSYIDSLKLVTERQWKMNSRNKMLSRGRLYQVIVMSFLIGSLFYNLGSDADNTRTYFGAAFMSVLFNAMGSLPQVAITIGNRPIFKKQRENFFYPSIAYSWAMALTQLPFSFLESFVFTIITYFLIGFTTDAAKYFFISWLIFFSASVSMSSLFRFIASISSDMVIANSVAGFVLLLLIINSGYAITRSSISPWWIWAYWISPFAYALRSLVINEFRSPKWDRDEELGENGEKQDVGIYALEQFDFHTDRYMIWVGIGYMWALFLLLTFFTAIGFAYLGNEKKKTVIVDDKQIAKAKKLALERKKKQEQMRLNNDIENGEGIDNKNNGDVSSSLSFQPITLTFHNLSYFVDDMRNPGAERKLLNNITGFAEPSVLTALMGGSGAGKTTLMDLLAGRKTMGRTEGTVLVNGHPKHKKTWSRVVGYVEQFDIHSPTPTVREALEYNARLRLDRNVSRQTVLQLVEEVLEIVDLTMIQKFVVSTSAQGGLSVEQRKRLSIACELVANPSVVFMDEPTSGLDARAASTVIRAVKNVAINGRTVMVTIHQPSIEIFEAFDALVLLKAGGTLLYFGSLGHESLNLINYFESIPNVPKITTGYNPATWMLEVTGGSMQTMVKPVNQEFTEIYAESELCKMNMTKAEQLANDLPTKYPELALKNRYASTIWTQIVELSNKFFVSYWRSPSYNFVRMIVTVIVALVFGTVYYDVGNLNSNEGEEIEVRDIQNFMGILFAGMGFMGMTNLGTVLPVVALERDVYYHERNSMMYSAFSYALAAGVVEIPYLLMQAVLFVPLIYFMVGFVSDVMKFVYFFIIFFETITLYTFYGETLTYVLPSPALAQVVGGTSHSIWTLFNGFMIASSQIPKGWKWMNKISPQTYIIYGITVSQLEENEAKVGNAENKPTVKKYIEDLFEYDMGFEWYCVIILLIYITVFR